MSRCRETAANEPLAGTAPVRNVWLIIEQPGAWGEDALLESDLPEGFGAKLKETVTDPAIGVVLARRPATPSVERRASARRRLWLAHTAPGGVRMRSGSLDDVHDLLKWDWEAIRTGVLPPFGRRSADPAMFVCTNGKKDLCCAEAGRQLVGALRPDLELTGQVFESSHLTGHRFAPTALLLPWGYLFGRLDESGARAALNDAWNGQLPFEHLRGRSALAEWAQVAEIAVREHAQVRSIDALDVVVHRGERVVPWQMAEVVEGRVTAQVRHADGRAWDVVLDSQDLVPRPLSCGAADQLSKFWRCASLSPAANWR